MESTKSSIELRQLMHRHRTVEFHISRAARDMYELQHALFSKEGHIITADYRQIQQLAERINAKRNVRQYPRLRVTAAELFAVGLMHEIFHHVIDTYIEEQGGNILEESDGHLRSRWNTAEIDRTLQTFIDEFPSHEVYSGETSPEAYLNDLEEGRENVLNSLEEMLLLWITNRNPAIHTYKELVDDTSLAAATPYGRLIDDLYLFMEKLPGVGETSLNLIDFLRMPSREAPDSIMDQLSYIAVHWMRYLGRYADLLLRSLDYLREERRPVFPPGPGPTYEIRYHGLDHEYEAFSEDTDWMPKVVLMAKSTLVWLDQLTRTYGRTIQNLDQIPDEELDRLAERGFNALWLIGLWERSNASRTIKRSCGNPEAEASAYSLKRYDIAYELGGWEALHALRQRCEQRGIRLASDMVPNHTGIDGDWVYDHPDWFLQLPHPP
ncbi:MAG: alpha-amylase family glycosyl hydrolase, partial [Spirochaetota bacterium]|nr:alpha-amylase family glycosyl hydrolase [Spirochaetota bacterium]